LNIDVDNNVYKKIKKVILNKKNIKKKTILNHNNKYRISRWLFYSFSNLILPRVIFKSIPNIKTESSPAVITKFNASGDALMAWQHHNRWQQTLHSILFCSSSPQPSPDNLKLILKGIIQFLDFVPRSTLFVCLLLGCLKVVFFRKWILEKLISRK
jgi:hypothetical protein